MVSSFDVFLTASFVCETLNVQAIELKSVRYVGLKYLLYLFSLCLTNDSGTAIDRSFAQAC